MSLTVHLQENALILRGRVWRADIEGVGISVSAAHSYGIITGDQEIVSFNRKYATNASELFAGLYEATFTGGHAPRYANRRLSSTRPVPFTLLESVTASVGLPIFGAAIRAGQATGNAQAAFSELLDAVVLKANTSYVVKMFNLGSAIATINAQFDLCTTEPLLTFSDFGG